VDRRRGDWLNSPPTLTEGWTIFRFTIRDLLILTVTAALAVGWWLDATTMRAELDQAYEVQFQAEARAGVAKYKAKVAKSIIDKLNAALPASTIPSQ